MSDGVRPACRADAPGLAVIHVNGWRSAYAGLLPPAYLANLSMSRKAAHFQASIAAGAGILVAEVDSRVVGYCSIGRPRAEAIAEGEVETLYVLDDYRDQGLGRQLLQAGAARLAAAGCRDLFLWVLEGNPSRWFYERMGGRPAMRATVDVAGRSFDQVAYVWDPIGLVQAAAAKL